MINREREGSLTSVLKDKGWINSISSGYSNQARGIYFFNIDVSLTEEGLSHIDEIITTIFQKLNMIRKKEPIKWIHDVCTL